MRRGDIVIAVGRGDYGKPRPHVVVQSDQLDEAMPSVILCPITSATRGIPFRPSIAPSPRTGLKRPSEIMTDKVQAVKRERIALVIGRLDDETMAQVDLYLAFVLGLR